MKILAIDLGTHCGWCLGTAGEIPTYGTLHLASAREIREGGLDRTTRTEDKRVRRMWKFIRDTCLREKPNIVIWEDVQFSTYTFQVQLWSSLRTALQLGARGAHDGSYPMIFECVPVATLKKFATRSGGADKAAMLRALRKKHPELELSGVDDNAVDAIWLHKWAEYHLARTFKPNTNEQRNTTGQTADQPANISECGEHHLQPNP